MKDRMKAPRFDVTSIGEIMIRLSVPTGERLDDTESLDVEMGGAEGNASIALARLGRRVSWLGRLPDTALGEYIVRTLRADGVDVSAVRRAPNERMGLYFIEYASTPRAINVIYDRADSAAARMTVRDVDWDTLLDTRILHLTGITPALSSSCREIIDEAVTRATNAGITVSFDVNYRAKLWDAKTAASTLRPLVEKANILLCKSSDASLLFGCTGTVDEKLLQLAKITRAESIYVTAGESGAALLHAGSVITQAALPVVIVDRVGSGDAFAAGVIDGLLDNNPRLGLQRGVAMAAIALSQHGDRVLTSRTELNTVLTRQGSDISR